MSNTYGLTSAGVQGMMREKWGKVIRVPVKFDPESGEPTKWEEYDTGVQPAIDELMARLGANEAVNLGNMLDQALAKLNITTGNTIVGDGIGDGGGGDGGGGGGSFSGTVQYVKSVSVSTAGMGVSIDDSGLGISISVVACDVTATLTGHVTATLTGSPTVTVTYGTISFTSGICTAAT